MVVAKTDRAHQALAAQFADHGRTGPLRRGYLAFVWGAPARPEGHHRRADRPPSQAAATGWRCAPSGRDGHHPLAGAGALHGQGRQAGRQPDRMPAGNRPHPPDPRPSGPYRPSAAGRRRSMAPASRPRRAACRPAAREALAGLGRQALHAYLLAVEHPNSGREAGVPIGTAGGSCPFTSQLGRRLTAPHLVKPLYFQGLDGCDNVTGGHDGVKRLSSFRPIRFGYAALRSGFAVAA